MRNIKFFLVVMLIGIASNFVYAQGIPSVRLRSTNGESVNTAELVGNGRPTVVAFFALWCKPCLKELSAIAEKYEQWQEQTGVQLIAVSVDDARSSNKVPAEVKARGFEWLTLLDPNGDLKRAMGVSNIPHLFLLNGEGKVVWQHTSYADGDEVLLYRKIQEQVAPSRAQ